MVRNTVGYAIDYPLLIPQINNLMVQVHHGRGHGHSSSVSHMAYLRRRYEVKTLSKEATAACCHRGGSNPPPHMIPYLQNGQAGVWKDQYSTRRSHK